MRCSFIGLLAIAIAGCAGIGRDAAKLKEKSAITAAIKRIVLVKGDEIPGHPKFTELGKVEGVCGRPPAYDDDASAATPGFKRAAYIRYGEKVDAIIRLDAWFMIGIGSSSVSQPGSSEGHFECRGIAVHFEPD